MTIFKGALRGSRMKHSRWFSKWFILPAVAVTMIAALVVGGSAALFTDTETSNDSTFAAWTSARWTQTSQADFEAGVPTSVNTTSSPGDVMLALTSNVITNSPTTNTGAAWTNPANAYADGGTAATITSGAPSGNNVWGTYGFSFTAVNVTQVRVRYDAWTTPNVTFQAAGAVVNAASGNVTPALPTGWAANDIWLLLIASLDNINSTVPAGWTSIDAGTNNGAGLRTTLYWRRAVAGDTAPLVTHTAGSGISAVIIGYRGVITSGSPFDVNQAVFVKTPASTTNNFGGGMTTTVNGDMIVLLSGVGGRTTSATYTGSPTPTERVDGPDAKDRPEVVIADFVLATDGATGARTSTISSFLNNGYQLSLRPVVAQIRVDVSWDGGTSWSSKATTTTTTSEATYWYDVTAATTWTPAKLASGQLQVRVDAQTVGTAATVNLDWLPVEVTYQQYVSSGTIASQVLTTITGSRWDALFWDESLATGTDITFAVRASDAVFLKDAVTPSWTSVGGTSPVLTGLTSGQYKQWRATLTSNGSQTNTPTLQEIRVFYYGG